MAPLGSRLKTLRPEEAALLSHLASAFPGARLSQTKLTPKAWIVLAGEHRDWQIWLCPQAGPDGPLRMTGDDGTPDALRAALALEAVEPLTAELERALGTALRVVQLTAEAPRLPFHLAGLGCSTLLAVEATGAVPALPERTPNSDRIAWVTIATRWIVIGPALTLSRIGQLQVDDMLLVPTMADARLAADGKSWSGRVDLTAQTFTLEQPKGDSVAMTDNGWAEVRTHVELVIDGGAMPVGTLAALEPGAVLTLDFSGESLPVEVRAGGARIGRGELVAVGDAFGVILSEVRTGLAAPRVADEPMAEPVGA